MAVEKILLQDIPWLFLGLWTIFSLGALIFRGKESTVFNFHVIEHIPAVFVTLGVLGTFAGVTYGLISFNLSPDEISNSISGLLSGLKNAFYTSLYGLSGSVLTGVIIRYQYANGSLIDPEIQQEEKLLEDLKDALNNFGKNLAMHNSKAIMSSLENVIKDFNDTFTELIGELVTENFKDLTDSVDQLVEWQKEYKEGVNSVLDTNKSLNTRTNDLLNAFEETHANIDNIRESSINLRNALIQLKESIEDESSLSGLISKLDESTENLVKVSNDADLFKNEIERIVNNVSETHNKVEGWLRKEEGVLDAATALNHTLSELRQFEITQIEKLDESFTKRLGQTFQNLDKLMKNYIQYLENNGQN